MHTQKGYLTINSHSTTSPEKKKCISGVHNDLLGMPKESYRHVTHSFYVQLVTKAFNNFKETYVRSILSWTSTWFV